MGGIVAAESILLLASEQPIPASASKTTSDAPNFASNTTQHSSTSTSKPQLEPDTGPPNFMFPHVQGMLAYDTPFLGLAPEMIAHSLEGGHKVMSGAYNTYNEVASMLGWGSSSESAAGAATAAKAPVAALPAPPASSMADAAAAPKWSSWGKYAMFAGAVGAVAAGGAAAYSQREKLSAGWSWAGSHLLFVGDLAKAERLKQRVESMGKLCSERGIGAANLYTNLGRGAREGYGLTETLAGGDRTFCNLPPAVKEGREQTRPGMKWVKAINEKAKDETTAHVSMFFPQDNPGFYALGEASKEIIVSWVDQSWYNSSSGKADEDELNETMNPSSIGKDWEGLDETAVHDDEGLQMREEENEESHDKDKPMLEGSILIDKSAANSTTFEDRASEGKTPLPKVASQAI